MLFSSKSPEASSGKKKKVGKNAFLPDEIQKVRQRIIDGAGPSHAYSTVFLSLSANRKRPLCFWIHAKVPVEDACGGQRQAC